MNMVQDEVARINAEIVLSNFEWEIRREIIDWLLNTSTDASNFTMQEIAEHYWAERLV